MTVYTIIYNNYDLLKEPRHVDLNVKYICYSNTPQESDVWEYRHVDLTCIKDQRKLKILGYQDIIDKHTVYLDASIQIVGSVYVFAYQWEEDFTLLEHRGRKCIYKEADAVLSFGKDKPDIVYNQIGTYAKEFFPENAGLIQTGMLMRRRNKAVDKLCNAWWKEVEKHSHRDQLSFNYVAWEQRFYYDTVPYTTFQSGFILHGHR